MTITMLTHLENAVVRYCERADIVNVQIMEALENIGSPHCPQHK